MYLVFRDKEFLAGPFDTDGEAMAYLHWIQSSSVHHATKYEGYRISHMVEVSPPEPIFFAICSHCGERVQSADLLADLRGEAFQDYYCKSHFAQLRKCP